MKYVRVNLNRVNFETLDHHQKEGQLIDVEQYWRNKEAALGEKI